MKTKNYKNNQGMAVFMVLVILSGILAVTLGAANIIMSGILMSRVQESSVFAYFAAEAGIERALWEVRKNYYSLPGESQSDLFTDNLANNSSYHVDYATSSPQVIFTSSGLYHGAKRSVQTTYQTE